MAASPVLSIKVLTDASAATAGLDSAAASVDKVGASASGASTKLDAAAAAVDKYGAAADTASAKSRDVSGSIDTVGGASGDTASALSALAPMLESAGFEGLAAGAESAAMALDAAEGATMLFKVAEDLTIVTKVKSTAAWIANTAAAVANKVATTAVTAASKAFAAAQWLVNAALTANPIGLIIALIVGLVAGLVLAYQKSTTFRAIVDAAFGAVKKAVETVVSFITDNLVPIFQTAYEAAKGPLESMKNAVKAAMDFMKGPIDAVKGAFDAVVGAIKGVIDWIGRLKFPTLPSWLPGDFLQSAPPSTFAAPAVAGAPSLFSARGGGGVSSTGGGGGITINVSVPPTANPVETGRAIVSMVRRFEAAAGPGWRTA